MESDFIFQHNANITDICISMQNDYIAAGDKRGEVRIYDLTNAPQLLGQFQNTCKSSQEDYKAHCKIRSIDSVYQTQSSLGILIGTLKEIKLWNIQPQKKNFCFGNVDGNQIFPFAHNSRFFARCKRKYKIGGNYMLHSVSKLGLNDNFLTSDDLRIVIWNIEQANQGCILVDYSPMQYTNLSEVITTMRGHYDKSHIFAWGCSRGHISIADLRQQLNCNNPPIQFQQSLSFNHYYEELISSIKSILFMKNDNYIATRDYFNLKIWDVRLANEPVKVYKTVNDIQLTLNDAFEQGLLNNEFNVSEWNNQLITGDYGSINLADLETQQRIYVQQAPYDPIQRTILLPNMYAYTNQNFLAFKYQNNS